jgi:hypothetical protein
MPDIKELTTSNAPYEAPLAKAFDKLTSQIFIFLLAYVILLIGLAVFGAELAAALRNLFYVIPIIGVVAYVWLKQQEIVRSAKKRGVDVKRGIVVSARNVQDQAIVMGATGVQGEKPGNVTVDVGRASGKSKVVGVDYATPDKSGDLQDIDVKQLLNIFSQLSSADKNELLMMAFRMRQKNSNDS